MNYTKGEWKARLLAGDWIISTDEELICRNVRHFNVHLIAAAPDMYEALRAIIAEGTRAVEECQLDKPVREIYEIDVVDGLARKALAKAEGKQ